MEETEMRILKLSAAAAALLAGTALAVAQSSSTVGTGGPSAGGGTSNSTIGTGGSSAGSGSGSGSASTLGTGGSSAGGGQSGATVGAAGSSASPPRIEHGKGPHKDHARGESDKRRKDKH